LIVTTFFAADFMSRAAVGSSASGKPQAIDSTRLARFASLPRARVAQTASTEIGILVVPVDPAIDPEIVAWAHPDIDPQIFIKLPNWAIDKSDRAHSIAPPLVVASPADALPKVSQPLVPQAAPNP
jgi:hypothetical protein